MSAQRVNPRIEGSIAAGGRVYRESAGGHRGGEHVLGGEQAEERERGRDLGAVQKRETFLRGELDRLKPCVAQRLPGRQQPSGDSHLADSKQGERKMGERSQVARGANRALGRDERVNALVVQAEKQIDQLRTHA